MKKILVPTDFSKVANNALTEAVHIARKSGAEIILLNVIEEGSSRSIRVTGEMMKGDVQENIFMLKLINKVKGQLDDIVNNNANVKITPELRLGNPYHGITDIISEHKVDLVVMGTQGSSGLEELLVGSNTEKVVRHAKCAVLSVCEPMLSSETNDVVYATNMGDDEERMVAALKTMQTMYDAKLHLTWINTPNNFERDKLTKQRMEKFARKHNLSNYTLNIYNDVTEEDGIISFAEDINANMIAMITHRRTGVAHLIAGSIAEDVVNHTKRPVLTLSVD